MSVKKILSFLIFAFLVTLAVQNFKSTDLSFMVWQMQMPLTLIILCSALLGVIGVNLLRRKIAIQADAQQDANTQSINLYVGNLAQNTTEQELTQVFSDFGEVQSVSLIKDKQSGEPKGYAFVRLVSSDDSQQVIEQLNGREWKGRALNVNYARNRGHHHRAKHRRHQTRQRRS